MRHHDRPGHNPGGLRLRDANVADLPVINEIYNHYVLHSTCTYQTEPVTAEQRAAWFAEHGPRHPVIVAELDGRVAGWGSLSRFHPRRAYEHTVEDSVYLHPEKRGRGLGTALLEELVARARRLGHHTVIAVISADQPASIALHRKLGFVEAARLREVGFKFGRWLDVVWMQRLMVDA
jgi:phosphinothricin acetyltransferase